MNIDTERPKDVAAIRAVTQAAFEGVAYSDQTESRIVDVLRDAGALSVSLVASVAGEVIGHAAFSPVRIDGQWGGWYGLGPVSIRPDHQRRGVGSAIIIEGLTRLKGMQAQGCVVFGDPGYYGRFGFVCDRRLVYAGAPDGYFQRRPFSAAAPTGEVTYHPAFDTA